MNALQDNRTKNRALPRVWKRMWSLSPGDGFEFKGRQFYATGGMILCFARVSLDMERHAWLFPWTRVRTNVLVRDAKPGGKSGFETVRREVDQRLRDADVGPMPLINNDDGRSGTSA